MHLERRVLLLPDRCDVQQHIRLPVALLGLMRLEQEHRRRAQDRGRRVVAVRLRDDARFLRHPRRQRMVEVVRVVQRVRQDELRPEIAVERREPVEHLVGDPHRVVADVEKDRPGAQDVRGAHGLVLPRRLHFLDRHSGVAPQLGGLAALAERQADDRDLPAALRVERDRAAGTPDEIRGMRADHDRRLRFLLGHGSPVHGSKSYRLAGLSTSSFCRSVSSGAISGTRLTRSASFGTVPADVRVGPVRAPQDSVRGRLNEGLREGDRVVKGRARGGYALRAAHFHPAGVEPHQIEQRAERRLLQARAGLHAAHVIDHEGERQPAQQAGELDDVGGVQVHDQMPSERPDALQDVVEHAQVRHASQMLHEVEPHAPDPAFVEGVVVLLAERVVDDGDPATAAAARPQSRRASRGCRCRGSWPARSRPARCQGASCNSAKALLWGIGRRVRATRCIREGGRGTEDMAMCVGRHRRHRERDCANGDAPKIVESRSDAVNQTRGRCARKRGRCGR